MNLTNECRKISVNMAEVNSTNIEERRYEDQYGSIGVTRLNELVKKINE